MLVGALIGLGASALIAPLAYGACQIDDSADGGSCGAKTLLVIGVDVAIGAAIGLLVGSLGGWRGRGWSAGAAGGNDNSGCNDTRRQTRAYESHQILPQER